MKLSEIKKLENVYADYKQECICGHVEVISPKKEFKLCSWCGRKIYTKKGFKEKLQKMMKGELLTDE